MTNKVYLDYAATTPVHPVVRDAMQPYFSNSYGNPSSIHWAGQQAEFAIEKARLTIADIYNCSPSEIIFTACGTESDNIALRGAALATREATGKNQLITTQVEHPAVLNTAMQLRDYYGFKLILLPVSNYGQVSPADLRNSISMNTSLVSIIYANNEIGSINPIYELGDVCKESNVLFHSDAVQAAAHLPIDMSTLPVDMLSIGAHKLYGPKGVGILFVREGTQLISPVSGGSQENGLRAGTHNVASIVGMAKAIELQNEDHLRLFENNKNLRDELIQQVTKSIPNSTLTGHPTERLPNHASFVFDGIDGNELVQNLDIEGFACSSGSACKTGNPQPSKVLISLGIDNSLALGSLRITLGRETKKEDIFKFTTTLSNSITSLRPNKQ